MEKPEGNKIFVNDASIPALEDFVLEQNGRWVDDMSRNGVTLCRDGDEYVVTMTAYEDDEVLTARASREEILEVLDWKEI